MKTFLNVLFFVAAVAWAQGATLTSSEQRTYNGYDYELWSENNTGTTSMTLTGDNGSGTNAKGGTFTCSWQNSLNILFRSGKKWGMTGGPTPKSAGNISIDFDATWSSNDGARMLGVYGWAFFPSGSKPTADESGRSMQFSDQIEYYIIQDRGGYNPATGGDTPGGGRKKGEATIDGIVYEFYVADRINRWALTGNGDVTFKQYFSVPKSTSSQRTKGIISVSKHFEEWENAGMKMMDCRLYEVAMKVESYTNNRDGRGNATVTKNLLTIGGSVAPTPSSSSAGRSSSSSPPVSCNYQTSFCGGMSFANVSNATSIPSTGDCIYIGDFEVIQPNLSSTIAINGVENTCGADWDDCPYNDKPSAIDGGYYVYVKTGTVNSYENNGWQDIVAKAKPNCTSFGTQSSSSRAGNSSSSVTASSSSVAASSSSKDDVSPIVSNSQAIISNSQTAVYYSLQGNRLGSAKPSKSGIYIVKEGYSVKKIVVK